MVIIMVLLLTVSGSAFAGSDPLPFWNDGASKEGAIAFVKAVTTKGRPSYVEPAERIATFDNDGKLMPYHILCPVRDNLSGMGQAIKTFYVVNTRYYYLYFFGMVYAYLIYKTGTDPTIVSGSGQLPLGGIT